MALLIPEINGVCFEIAPTDDVVLGVKAQLPFIENTLI